MLTGYYLLTLVFATSNGVAATTLNSPSSSHTVYDSHAQCVAAGEFSIKSSNNLRNVTVGYICTPTSRNLKQDGIK